MITGSLAKYLIADVLILLSFVDARSTMKVDSYNSSW